MTKLGDPTGLVEYLPAPVPQIRPHFGTGDVVWAQARGLPSWPGKIVDEAEVGKGRPDDGKVSRLGMICRSWKYGNVGYYTLKFSKQTDRKQQH